VAEMSSDVFAFDTRFFRTLGPLLMRPGFLTTEYLSGRREPYVPPLRTYVFASIVFFALVALFGDALVRLHVDTADPDAERGASALVNTAMTYVHFFFVPLFAGLVMLLFRRPKRYYVEHLVFAFHYGAFAFLLVTIFGGVSRVLGGSPHGPQPPAVKALSVVWGTALFTYLVLALRRVYRRSWAGTVLRAAAMSALYLLAFLLVNTVLIVIAYLLYQRGGRFQ
jgi:hypothetical protein